jgi:regulator of protease activity HflC (stomatin/prohibitin superfamily)
MARSTTRASQLVSASVGARNFFTIINQGQVAFRECLGKGRERLEPGPCLNIPIVHTLTRIDLREQSSKVLVLGYTQDNVPVKMVADVFFTVTDAERASFSVKSVDAAIASVAASTVRAVVGRFEYDAIIRARTALSMALIAEIGSSIEAWGVACHKVEVLEFCPQNESVAHQLELQVEAERARRKTDLDTRASIAVAEGRKRATELEAEGQALAAKVNADAALYAARQAATAERYAVEQRGEARANEVRAMARVLGSATQVAEFIIQQRKLEHLAAIASTGSKTNTYMVPDVSALLPTLATNSMTAVATAVTTASPDNATAVTTYVT